MHLLLWVFKMIVRKGFMNNLQTVNLILSWLHLVKKNSTSLHSLMKQFQSAILVEINPLEMLQCEESVKSYPG